MPHVPPDTLAVPCPPSLNPRMPSLLVTLPPGMKSWPVPEPPTSRYSLLAHVPPEKTAAEPLLPALLPIWPNVLVAYPPDVTFNLADVAEEAEAIAAAAAELHLARDEIARAFPAWLKPLGPPPPPPKSKHAHVAAA